MKLSNEQILKLLQKPLNGDAVTKGADLQKKHKVHITGEGYQELITQVEGFEVKRNLTYVNRFLNRQQYKLLQSYLTT